MSDSPVSKHPRDTVNARYVLRWIGVLPGAALCALAAQFPIHWVVLILRFLGPYVFSDPDQQALSIFAIPSDVLEQLAVAFTTPLIIVSVGAEISPRHKIQTAIALAILVGVVYGVLATFIGREILAGVYTPGRLVRLAVTVVLCVAGLAIGLRYANSRARFVSHPSTPTEQLL